MTTKPIKIATRFKKLETIMASFLLFMPLILILISREVRPSISDYAYSKINNIFSGLLWCSAIIFLYNGVLTKKWYNIVLCVALIGVSATPHLDFPLWHYSFAVLFFIGSVFVMIYFSSAKQRWFKILAGIVILTGLLGSYFNYYSLFYAEWIGLLPITLHYIAESLNKID